MQCWCAGAAVTNFDAYLLYYHTGRSEHLQSASAHYDSELLARLPCGSAQRYWRVPV